MHLATGIPANVLLVKARRVPPIDLRLKTQRAPQSHGPPSFHLVSTLLTAAAGPRGLDLLTYLHRRAIASAVRCAVEFWRKSMYRIMPTQIAGAMLLVLGFSTPAGAHCEAGHRIFAATLTVDDPCVTDELSLPTIAGFKNGDNPSAEELDVSGEYSKTITKNFGVSLEEEWIHLRVPGDGNHAGFD
ncbi:MAG: hypothetical protein ACREC3_01105, partial [Methyloceanibacter sp.]